MRKSFVLLPLMCVVCCLAGCASNQALCEPSMDRARASLFNDPNQAKLLEKSMTDRDLANLLDARIQPKLPTSLAVARVVSNYNYSENCRLETIDSAEMEGWEKIAAGLPHIYGVHPVTILSAQNDRGLTTYSLRQAAAKMNCELLLVCLQADSTVNNLNDAAVLYWTIIGLWLVPGNTVEHKTVIQAVLMDTRTGAILGTVGGDSRLKRYAPAAFADNRRHDLADEASAAALADLQKGAGRLLKQLPALNATSAPANRDKGIAAIE